MSSPRPADADFEQRVRDSFARQQFLTLLGVELARVEPGRVVLELVPRAEHGQQHGYVHAGVLTTLADAACGYAAFTLMPAGSNVLSVEFKMNLLRPAVGDRIVADARVVRAGRSVTVCMADVLALAGGESRQVALLTGTMMRVEDTARG
jgi:uncharacterized protein (TIGR00369 family)